MKILVRLFLIILVMFSYVQADEKFLEDLYQVRIKFLAYIIIRDKEKPWLTDRWKQESAKLKVTYKKSKHDAYKYVYDIKVGWIHQKVREERSKGKSSQYYEEQIKLYNKQYTDYLNSLRLKKTSNSIKFLDWTKKKEIPKLATKKLKVSTVNMSKNTSKVSLKSSNLKTTVKTNNINISNKAKASVGSVSIGKE